MESGFQYLLQQIVGIISDDDVSVTLAVKKEIESPQETQFPSGLFENLDNPWRLVEGDRKFAIHKLTTVAYSKLIKMAWDGLNLTNAHALNVIGPNGRTSLIVAVDQQELDIMRLLLDLKANVNAQDEHGMTALHHCVELDSLAAAKLLIGKADLQMRDKYGFAAFKRCSHQNHCLPVLERQAGLSHPTGLKPVERQCPPAPQSSRNKWFVIVGDPRDAKHDNYGKSVLGDAYIVDDTSSYSPSIPLALHRTQYLISEPIPGDAKFPISRVHVVVEGRDQGWSSEFWFENRPEGSFTSNTRYGLGILRDGRIVLEYELAINKHRSKQTHCFERSWHLDNDLNDVQFCGRRSQTVTEQSHFVSMLRIGDSVAVFPNAGGEGWLNITKSAEIKIFYVE